MKPKPNPIRHIARNKGFTLVELLVVIVIIIVLVSIGFPLAKNMQANSTRAQCINQLRTWGVAMGGYSADHDGKVNWEHWPSIGNDPLSYSPYIVYWTADSDDRTGFEMQLTQRNCPAVKYNKKAGNSPVNYSTIQPTGVAKVGITGRINGQSSDYPLAKIKNPARFMFMIDTMAAAGKTGYSINTADDFTSRVKPLTMKGVNLRHKNAVNALFADFSVRQMNWAEVEKGLTYWATF